MKYVILLWSVFCFCFVSAQSDLAEIDSAIHGYYKAVQQKDYDGILDHLYGGLFRYISRSSLKSGLEELYSDSNVLLTLKDHQTTKISPVVIDDDVKYASVDFSFTLELIQKGEPSEAELERLNGADYFDATLASLKSTYGANNVTMDKEQRKYEIKSSMKMLAVYEPKYGEWRFTDMKPKTYRILEQLIPKKILKKFS